MARIIGFDVGRKRLGVAVSDESATIATPVVVLDVDELKRDSRPLKRLVQDYEPDNAIVGLPVTLAGEEGPQAEEVRAFAGQWIAPLGIDVTFVDERLSSVDAKRALREVGMDEKQARGKVDMIAASLFLQSYLDSLKGSNA